MRFYTVILGGSAALALIAVAMARVGVTQTPVEVRAAEDRFDNAWTDTMKVVGDTALRKADRARIVSTDPKPIQTEKIEPEETKPVIPPVLVVERVRHRVPHREARGGDVCTRHGMRKVVTRGGKSWRCKR